MKEHYEAIKSIISDGILLESTDVIQQKMIELSKMNNVNAIKVLYLIIDLQEKLDEGKKLITNLDYQSEIDQSTICINLANNTVKASYRLLDLLLQSFIINPNLKDDRNSTIYGYLMAHLIQIYRSDNNFHSRKDLEKLMVKLSKSICMQYQIDLNNPCYSDRHGETYTYNELIEMYRKKNNYYLDSKSSDGQYKKMDKILKNMNSKESILTENNTIIKDWDAFHSDERFTKYKRYTLDTLDFTKKNL